MPFRTGKPPRPAKQRPVSDSANNDSDDTNPRSPTLQKSVQGLCHLELVGQQHQQWQKQFGDASNTPNTADDMIMPKCLSQRHSFSTLEQNNPQASTSPLPTVVTKLGAKLDLEATVNLLQELKKNASPEELIALHRALLPIKDETPTSPQLPCSPEDACIAVPPLRKRSAMPPGLATRSGISGDLLRRPGDSTPYATPAATAIKASTLPWLEPPRRYQSRNASPARIGTPNEQAPYHAGAFEPGTLRIMNGRASPDPSIISRMTADGDEPVKGLRAKDANCSQEESGGSVRINASELAQTRDSRRQRETLVALPQPLLTRPTSIDVQAEDWPQTQLHPDSQSPQRHSFAQTTISYDTDDTLRFLQGLNHRAAHLSQEYLLDCNITASPYEEKDGLSEFTKHLDSVFDDREARQECQIGLAERAHALSKLEGDYRPSNSPKWDHNSNLCTDDKDSKNPPVAVHRQTFRKMDSGYCSDGQSKLVRQNLSPEVQQPAARENYERGYDGVPEAKPPSRSFGHTEQFPNSSPYFDSNNSQDGSDSAKKSPLTLFKSKSKLPKSGSCSVLGVGHDSPSTFSMSEANATEQTISGIDDTSGRYHRQQRKLQKPMPKSEQRKRTKTEENVTPIQSMEESPESSIQSYSQQIKPTKLGCQTETHPLPRAGSIDAATGVAAVSISPVEPRSRFSRLRGKSFSRKRSKSIGEANTESLSLASPASHQRSQSNIAECEPIPMPPARRFTDEPPATGKRHHDRESRNIGLTAKAPGPHPAGSTLKPGQRGASVKPRHNRFYSNSYLSEEGLTQAVKREDQSTGIRVQHHDSEDNRATDQQSRDTSSAAPTHRNAAMTPVAVGSGHTVEDRFPDWEGKPSKSSSPSNPSCIPLQSQQPIVSSRAKPGEIPELPAFPADIQSRVNRADQIVARKLKYSPCSSPTTSARNSVESDMSKPHLNKNVSTRTGVETKKLDYPKRPSPLHNASTDEAAPEHQGSARKQIFWADSTELPRQDQPHIVSFSTHDAQHPGWPGWERQSALWRQRKESSKETEKRPADSDFVPPTNAGKAPQIVFSRCITPVGVENAHDARSTASESANQALKFAQSYTNLIEEDKENITDKAGASRAQKDVSSTTVVTVHSFDDKEPKIDIWRTGSAVSTSSTTTTNTTAVSRYSWSGSRSSHSSHESDDNAPPQRLRTPSDQYVPYRRSHAAQVERSRAPSLARNSCQIIVRSNESLAPPKLPNLKKAKSESPVDRYSGGMNFGWDREAGFGGSAGTRTSNIFDVENRKSVQTSGKFGLDLSDIPVYLRKAPTFTVRLS